MQEAAKMTKSNVFPRLPILPLNNTTTARLKKRIALIVRGVYAAHRNITGDMKKQDAKNA